MGIASGHIRDAQLRSSSHYFDSSSNGGVSSYKYSTLAARLNNTEADGKWSGWVPDIDSKGENTINLVFYLT